MKYIQDASGKWPEHSVISLGPYLQGFVEERNFKKKSKPQACGWAMPLNELTAEVI